MKFRYHRGSLEESMQTLQDFNPEKIIKNSIIGDTEGVKLIINRYGYDNRIERDIYIVTILNERDQFPVGFLHEE